MSDSGLGPSANNSGKACVLSEVFGRSLNVELRPERYAELDLQHTRWTSQIQRKGGEVRRVLASAKSMSNMDFKEFQNFAGMPIDKTSKTAEHKSTTNMVI